MFYHFFPPLPTKSNIYIIWWYRTVRNGTIVYWYQSVNHCQSIRCLGPESGFPWVKLNRRRSILNMWVCLKIVYPYTQWFCWSLSLWKMAISLGILTQHFQTNPHVLLSLSFNLSYIEGTLNISHCSLFLACKVVQRIWSRWYGQCIASIGVLEEQYHPPLTPHIRNKQHTEPAGIWSQSLINDQKGNSYQSKWWTTYYWNW